MVRGTNHSVLADLSHLQRHQVLGGAWSKLVVYERSDHICTEFQVGVVEAELGQ
jgi:hypothetical protein